MELLRAGEKRGRPLDHAPPGFDPEGIEDQRKRRQDFRDTTAIERRADVDDVQRAEAISFLQYAFGCRITDQRRI